MVNIQIIGVPVKKKVMDHIDKIKIKGYSHNYFKQDSFDHDKMLERSLDYYQCLNSRRSVREFSNQPVAKEIINNIILAGSTAPSGAHKQPWTFCAISNKDLKSKIRTAVEVEEKESYEHRMSERWKKDLEPLGTDMNKPFIEIAPWLIAVFKKAYEYDENGNKINNYYVNESVGIACGMLITAIHNAGLVTLTHTPSPMSFLTKILERPPNERAYLLLPVGYANNPAYVPDIKRKGIDKISVFYE